MSFASELEQFFADIKVDFSTASIKFSPQIQQTQFHRIREVDTCNLTSYKFLETDLRHDFNEKVTAGRNHQFVRNRSQYELEMPRNIIDMKTVIEKLEMIQIKSADIAHVDNIMGTYLYDFFKSSRSVLLNLIDRVATFDECFKIMHMARKIAKNFIAESLLDLTIEDLAAFTYLILLTWRTALRFDSLCKYPIGLKDYSAPLSGNCSVQIASFLDIHGDHQEELDQNYKHERVLKQFVTVDVTPCWLSSEDEYFAWKMYQEANSALEIDINNKPQFISPSDIFPDPATRTRSIDSLIADLDPKTRNLLTKLSKIYPEKNAEARNFYNYSPFLKDFFVLIEQTTDMSSHPQFYSVLDISISFYVGLWNRPTGGYNNGAVLIYDKNKSHDFGVPYHIIPPLRKPSHCRVGNVRHYGRNRPEHEILNYRQKSRRLGEYVVDGLFLEHQFSDIRKSDSLREPYNVINIYAIFSFFEGSDSCHFFSFPQLVFVCDRLFGIKDHFTDVQLIHRITGSLYTSVSNDLRSLKILNSQIASLFRNELVVARAIQATLALSRFLVRVYDWNLIDFEFVTNQIFGLYLSWSPLSKLKSELDLSETTISRIHTVLWSLLSTQIGGENMFSIRFTMSYPNPLNLSLVNPVELYHSLLVFHYFIAKSYHSKVVVNEILSDEAEGSSFDLCLKIFKHFRNSPRLLNESEAEMTGKLLIHELYSYYYCCCCSDHLEVVEAADSFQIKYFDNFDVFEFSSIEKNENNRQVFTFILRISTGNLVINDAPKYKINTIFNNETFKTFFHSDSLKEKDKNSFSGGNLNYFYDKLIYGIKNYDKKNIDYVFVSSGCDLLSKMDIYLIRNDQSLWLWIKTSDTDLFDSITRPLKLMNLDRIHIFCRFSKTNAESELDLNVIFIRDHTPIPVYELTIKNINTPSKSCFIFKTPQLNHLPLILLNNDEAQKHLPNPFKAFANPAYISIYRNMNNNGLVIICGPYRFGSDSIFPVVFEERTSEDGVTCFYLVNDLKWKLADNQLILNDSKIFLGGLKMVSVESSHEERLLIPHFKHCSKTILSLDTKLTDLIKVEFIPISATALLPRNRQDRLLIVYNCMINLDTNGAKNMLHPSLSIDQNTPFFDAELQIFDWILDLSLNNPEINALKMILSAQIVINIQNFPRYFVGSKFDWIHEKLEHVRDDLSKNYLFGYREISEKFHLHRIVPETLNMQVFNQLFHQKWNLVSTSSLTDNDNYTKKSVKDKEKEYQDRASVIFRSWYGYHHLNLNQENETDSKNKNKKKTIQILIQIFIQYKRRPTTKQ